MPATSALLLAAGLSRRMGPPNKLLLDGGGAPVVRRTAAAVCASRAAEVIVVLGHEADAVRAALAGLEVRCVLNDRYAEGLTSSIQAGVRAASPEAAGYMVCLADQPHIEAAEYDRLLAALEAGLAVDARRIVAPVHDGRRGHPVLFAAAYRDDLLRHADPSGCRALVHRHAAHLREVAMETDHVLADLDTPEDYERLRPKA